jgi:myo-inositol-1(or 4)-monophosphatase
VTGPVCGRSRVTSVDDLEVATAAARAGGAILREAFGRAVDADYKGRFDPVTAVDRAAERAIVQLVAHERPDDAIVAEEAGGDEYAGRHWLIDPLDGTVNFIRGIPQISVSIALWEGVDPLVGVVLDPLRDELFTAAAGQGARLGGSVIAVTGTDTLERAVVATGFPYDHGEHAAEYVTALGAVLAKVNGIRRFGSAALDLAWVAAGRYDAYFELGVAPWDQAAGIVLVREAGGMVTDPFGTPSVPVTSMVLASNSILHQSLADIIAPLVPAHRR